MELTVPQAAAPGSYQVQVDGEECTFANGTSVVTLDESVSLVKTVGTTADEWATTTRLSVVAGTTVHHCCTVTNNTQSTPVTHSPTDDELGALLTDVAQDLAPGASADTVALAPAYVAQITATATNTTTWTARSVQSLPFGATDSAVAPSSTG